MRPPARTSERAPPASRVKREAPGTHLHPDMDGRQWDNRDAEAARPTALQAQAVTSSQGTTASRSVPREPSRCPRRLRAGSRARRAACRMPDRRCSPCAVSSRAAPDGAVSQRNPRKECGEPEQHGNQFIRRSEAADEARRCSSTLAITLGARSIASPAASMSVRRPSTTAG